MALTVTTAELALMLGSEVDEDRAALLLELAGDLCASIVTPLPDEAKVVVLGVAARGYTNPEGLTQETVGPYNVSHRWSGIYLTSQERAALRRMSGSGGAFSIGTMPDTAGVPVRNPWGFARAEEWARNRGDI